MMALKAFQAGVLLLTLACGLVSSKVCQDVMIDVNLGAENFIFNLVAPATDLETSNFILNLVRQGHIYTKELLTEPPTDEIIGVSQVACTFCYPDSGPSSPLLILTHGLAFDRQYWALPYGDGAYSFTNAAVDGRGYSTLSWDRIGTGSSSRGHPINELQAPLEVAALTELTKMARKPGGLPVDVPVPDIWFDKVIHVGHSFGSALTYTLAKDNIDLSDGLILTGFSQNASFLNRFALAASFVAAPTVQNLVEYGAGYLGIGGISGVQQLMFAPNQFDPAVLQATWDNIHPVTVGELLTSTAGSGMPSTFGGPVLVITGERDLPFCGGDCLATGGAPGTVLDISKVMLPESRLVETAVVQAAGHALNADLSYASTYDTICNFIDQHIKA